MVDDKVSGPTPFREHVEFVGNVAGIGSFIVAIAQANVSTLTTVQKWGLAVAAAVSVWVFFLSTHIGVVDRQAPESSGKRLGFVFFGGLILAGLLMALLPFFTFGIASSQHDILIVIFAAAYVIASILWCLGSLA